jgi:DNA-binding NarL/FixJ family response regulator
MRVIIEGRPGLVVVGEAGNRADALAIATREQPDIILLDLLLGGESGLEVLPELLLVARQARVLIFTGLDDQDRQAQAIRLGAMGVVLKGMAPQTIIKAIEKVHAGEVWLDRSMMARMLTEMSHPAQAAASKAVKVDPHAMKIATLTEREREIISLIGDGMKNREIASRLFISEITVRHHLSSIFSKLEVADRLSLAIYAYQFGLAKTPDRPTVSGDNVQSVKPVAGNV